MYMLSGAIAHEVKNPMATIITCNEVITDILNRTVKAANCSTNQYTITIDMDEYDFLMRTQESVQKVGAKGMNTINSILTSLKNSVVGDEKKLHPIQECVKQAIDD